MYILVAGAGIAGRELARRLHQSRHDVVVVETNKDVCDELAAKHGLVAVNGSATDIDVLEEAGLQKADVAVALMRRDADNLAFALLAKHFGVPRIFVRMRNPRYRTAFEKAGATNIMNPAEMFINNVILDIEQPDFVRVATLGGGKASVVITRIADNSSADGKTIAEVTRDERFPKDCVVAGIYRTDTDELIIPRGDDRFRAGDSVFLVANTERIRDAAACLGVRVSRKQLRQ